MHVCILSRNAPAANPRVVKEASALVQSGYKVTVVCGAYGGWAEKFERGVLPVGCQVRPVFFGPQARLPRRVLQVARRTVSRCFASSLSSEPVAFLANSDVSPGLLAVAREVDADIFIAHLTAALPAAGRAAARLGVPYAFDAEDFHLGD